MLTRRIAKAMGESNVRPQMTATGSDWDQVIDRGILAFNFAIAYVAVFVVAIEQHIQRYSLIGCIATAKLESAAMNIIAGCITPLIAMTLTPLSIAVRKICLMSLAPTSIAGENLNSPSKKVVMGLLAMKCLPAVRATYCSWSMTNKFKLATTDSTSNQLRITDARLPILPSGNQAAFAVGPILLALFIRIAPSMLAGCVSRILARNFRILASTLPVEGCIALAFVFQVAIRAAISKATATAYKWAKLAAAGLAHVTRFRILQPNLASSFVIGRISLLAICSSVRKTISRSGFWIFVRHEETAFPTLWARTSTTPVRAACLL
jgi:hypothetical protein